MTKASILEAQNYLKVRTQDGYKRVVDIHSLLRRHSMSEVLRILRDYLKQKEQSLRNMILIDKTNQKVDQIVASMFRISMAIKSLEEREEVIILERPKQRTEKSGELHQRDSGGHSGSGIGENILHDGKNRKSGQTIQRAA